MMGLRECRSAATPEAWNPYLTKASVRYVVYSYKDEAGFPRWAINRLEVIPDRKNDQHVSSDPGAAGRGVHDAILALQNQDEAVYEDSEMLLIRLGGRGSRLTRSVSYPP